MHKPGGTGTTEVATRRTVSLYNVMGELVSRTEGMDASATAGVETEIAYNGAGQPTTHTVDGAVAATFAYDSSGFRDSVASPDFGTVRFTHTRFGEPKTRADGKGTTTWTRDKLGRATSTWSGRDSFIAADASTTRPWAGS